MRFKKQLFLLIFLSLLFLPLQVLGFEVSLSDKENSIVRYNRKYLEEYDIPINDIKAKRNDLDNLTEEIFKYEKDPIDPEEDIPPIDIVFIKLTFEEALYDLRIAIQGNLEDSIYRDHSFLYFFSENTETNQPYSLEYNFSKGLWNYEYEGISFEQKENINKIEYHENKNGKKNWTELYLKGIINYQYFGKDFDITQARFFLCTYWEDSIYIETIPHELELDFSSMLIPILIFLTIAFIVSLIILIRKKIIFKRNGRLRRLFIKRFNVKGRSKKRKKSKR